MGSEGERVLSFCETERLLGLGVFAWRESQTAGKRRRQH